MELTVGLALGALPVALLGASVALSAAYDRLQKRNQRTEQD